MIGSGGGGGHKLFFLQTLQVSNSSIMVLAKMFSSKGEEDRDVEYFGDWSGRDKRGRC